MLNTVAVFVGAGSGTAGKGEGMAGVRHQEKALHMVCSNTVNVAQHRPIQDTADPFPFLLQPWQNQCLNHLVGRKGRSQTRRSPGGSPTPCNRPSPSSSPWVLTSCPSSARPAMEPYRVVHGVFSSTQLCRERRKLQMRRFKKTAKPGLVVHA